MTDPARTDESPIKTIRIHVWADDRLWTVDFEKVVVNTGKDDCHIYEARGQAGPVHAKATIWSVARVVVLAYELDQKGALAWYCRHFRKNAPTILSGSTHHVFLDEGAIGEYFPPKSGKPADLVEREIDGLLFEAAVRAAMHNQDPLLAPSAWPIHGRFLQEIVPQAYPALRGFYDLYVGAMNREWAGTNNELWSAGVYALWLLDTERTRLASEVNAAGPSVAQRQSSQPPERFEPIEQIGGGGYGEVWKCRDNQLRRDVAIKFLRPTQGLSTALDHARALARAQHPNIVTVYQVEILPFPGDEFGGMAVDAIVMELLQGEPLAERLKGPPFSIEEIRSIATQVFDAVEHIHGRGLAHGDIHAGNIVIDSGNVKVIDILYLTGETLALMGTSSKDHRLRRDIIRTAGMISDMMCMSKLPPIRQDGLRQMLASAESVAEQRNILLRFLFEIELVQSVNETLNELRLEPADAHADEPPKTVERDTPTLDDLVLKAACEHIIGEGLFPFAEVESLLGRLPPETGLADVQESLEVLNSEYLVEASPTSEGITALQVTRHGFETYAEIWYPAYSKITADVRRRVGEETAESNSALAEALGVPRVVIDFALDELEAAGLCEVARTLDGHAFVHNVSAKLRRETRAQATTAKE